MRNRGADAFEAPCSGTVRGTSGAWRGPEADANLACYKLLRLGEVRYGNPRVRTLSLICSLVPRTYSKRARIYIFMPFTNTWTQAAIIRVTV